MFDLILLCIWWLIPAATSCVLMVSTMLTCWFWAMFVLRESKDLPWYLAWFGQWDDNLRAMREGKSWTDKKYVQWIRKYFPNKFGWWLEASIWIFRNPSQYFDYWQNGQTVKPGWDENGNVLPFEIIVKGNPFVSDKGPVRGWYLKLLKTSDRLIPNFRYVNSWLHLWLGWQFPDDVQEIRPHSKAQLKFTVGIVAWNVFSIFFMIVVALFA